MELGQKEPGEPTTASASHKLSPHPLVRNNFPLSQEKVIETMFPGILRIKKHFGSLVLFLLFMVLFSKTRFETVSLPQFCRGGVMKV